MPLQSREVVTLRLIFDCAEEEDEDIPVEQARAPLAVPHLLLLPVEVRLKILRYLLRMDRNRTAHTRRAPTNSIYELLRLDPRRILEAAPFRHRGAQEINGSPPVIHSCHLDIAVLKTCNQLYWEGRTVLYRENKIVGVHSGVKGLGAKLRNYGIPIWGPLPSSRLISFPPDVRHPGMSKFDPVMLFSGLNTKPTTPLYITSYKDSADFMHALWIMIKCPFARGMRYNLTLSSDIPFRYRNRTDSFVKCAVLPWLHNRINSINFHTAPYKSSVYVAANTGVASPAATQRLQSIRLELTRHVKASKAEPNLHGYNVTCSYLEQLMLQAELSVQQTNFLNAELLYERVCYEASSVVRTRTSELVDVSSKTKEGINRVCKLIAVSAYRLCELRSGSLQLIGPRLFVSKGLQGVLNQDKTAEQVQEAEIRSANDDKDIDERDPTQETTSPGTSDPVMKEAQPHDPNEQIEWKSTPCPKMEKAAKIVVNERSNPRFARKTTRLAPQLARELAISSGLLALRLPCAAPLPEWNIRLDIMLLRLFAERNDIPNAVCSIRRIHTNCAIVWKEVKAKNKTGPCWQALGNLTADLAKTRHLGGPPACLKIAERCQRVVSALWGDRLRPRKSYIGLIWTFRWAA